MDSLGYELAKDDPAALKLDGAGKVLSEAQPSMRWTGPVAGSTLIAVGVIVVAVSAPVLVA